MGLTRHRLGEFMEVSTENNRNLLYGEGLIRGVTTKGILTQPKGDVSGVNLKPYKLVRRGAFVYNPSRLDLGSIACSTEELCIVSHLYIVFYLNEAGIQHINPTYLYMYFRRNEFLREVTFRNFGSQRPEFNDRKMADIEIDLPPIEIQRKYSAIYESMLANQECYERGLEDLKLTCDGFVEKLMHEQSPARIAPYIHESDSRNGEFYGIESVRGISIEKKFIPTKANMSGVNLSGYKTVDPRQMAFVSVTSRNSDRITIAMNESEKTYLVSATYIVFESDESVLLPEYLMLFFSRSEFDRYARFNSWGSARETFNWTDIQDVEIPIPNIETQKAIAGIYKAYRMRRKINEQIKVQLKDICPILIKGSIEEASRH